MRFLCNEKISGYIASQKLSLARELQTVDKAPSCEGAFLVSWLQKLCTYKHIRSSENAVFTGLFTTFLV